MRDGQLVVISDYPTRMIHNYDMFGIGIWGHMGIQYSTPHEDPRSWWDKWIRRLPVDPIRVLCGPPAAVVGQLEVCASYKLVIPPGKPNALGLADILKV